MLTIGDPVLPVHVRSMAKPRFALGSIAGRYMVITFLGGSRARGAAELAAAMTDAIDLFDDRLASAFIVTVDPRDERGPFQERLPGLRVLLDFDLHLARIFRCLSAEEGGRQAVNLVSWILDPGMRVAKMLPISDPHTHVAEIRAALDDLRRSSAHVQEWAPILAVPGLFEPQFCKELLAYAELKGMAESGFMNTDPGTGQTILVKDHRHKRRLDTDIEDETLRAAIRARLHRRLVPQIERAFQFKATRIERYIIACYDAKLAGHFRAHRDNTTLGTAHRRFAVSIGLNSDYEGGELRFPEFGERLYRPEAGGAIIFSCSLLHEVLPVKTGQRFAVLPFLYDDAAAKVRLDNAQHLQDPELRDNVLRAVQ